MEELFDVAENFRMIFNHPYVGTEHFLLAFLKKYKLNKLDFFDFKEYVKEIIGYGTISNEYILYTPILRDIKNNCTDVIDSVIKILEDEDSIAHNILVCKKIKINELIDEIRTLE